jgi:hypothetical protein
MIKVSAGLSRKVGEANYSSRGGSVHLEQEFDAGVIHQPDRLRDGIRELFALARQALDEELGEGVDARGPEVLPKGPGAGNGDDSADDHSGNGSAEGGITVLPAKPKPQGPLASEKQVNYLGTLCERQRRDLGELCQERYGMDLAWLNRRQAAELIDWLRQAPVLAR